MWMALWTKVQGEQKQEVAKQGNGRSRIASGAWESGTCEGPKGPATYRHRSSPQGQTHGQIPEDRCVPNGRR